MNCTDSNFMESSEEILCNVDGRFELSDSNVGGHYHVCDSRRLLLWKATEAEFISMWEPDFNVSLHKWATSARPAEDHDDLQHGPWIFHDWEVMSLLIPNPSSADLCL